MVGGIGVMELTAHSIATNIFMIAVMPMAGMSVAVSLLVAQRLGEGSPQLAKKATLSAVQLAMPIFVFVAALLFFMPNVFIQPFSGGMTAELNQSITPLMHDLLKGVALYCLFDAIFMLYSGALRGAGDTRFVAIVGVGFSWFVLVIPTILLVEFADEKLRWSWLMLVLYMFFLCIACVWRFGRGKWQKAVLIN
jgi:MATE family multidrug resistance protein